jgi:hypothetical protein
MLDSMRRLARPVAILGVAAGLTVGGVALAQGESGGGSKTGHAGAPSGKRMPPPMMFGAPGGKDLTYAQMHVQHNGEAEVIRVDQGEITAVDDASITLKENDGNEVTVAVDEDTKVLAGPGSKTDVSDLEAGQEVTVCGPEGEAAKTIMVPPKRGEVPQGAPGGSKGGQLPPPPGAQMRG